MSTFASRIVGADGITWWSPIQMLATNYYVCKCVCACVYSVVWYLL